MKLIYRGNAQEVFVPLSGGREIWARNGEPVEVPDYVAESLLEQSIWLKAPEGTDSQP